MSKYIDKDKVLEYIIFGVVGKDITCGELTRAIESLPTIDIVHCKDCKHYISDGGALMMCEVHDGLLAYEDDYCSYGERTEE